MLVFIDESGCPGYQLNSGADPVFVIAMVAFASAADAEVTEQVICQARDCTRHKSEFKFSKCRDEVRDTFFRYVSECPFRVSAVVVDKRCLLRVADSFYSFFAKRLLALAPQGRMHVRIDGSADRASTRALRKRLSAELPHRIQKLQMANSATNSLIQLADMSAGAIARAYRDRQRADRWLRILRPRIAEIREYK